MIVRLHKSHALGDALRILFTPLTSMMPLTADLLSRIMTLLREHEAQTEERRRRDGYFTRLTTGF